MKKLLLIILIFISIQMNTNAQGTVLAPGDVAIVYYQADTPDEFTFITFVDLVAGTTIYFTDCGTVNGGSFLSPCTEGAQVFVAAAAITAGTVVEYPGGQFSSHTDSRITGSMGLATGGDQIIIFQDTDGAGGTDPAQNPAFIFAFNAASTAFTGNPGSSSTETGMPQGLAAIPNASLAVGSGSGVSDENDNSVFNTSLAPFASLAAAQTAILNPSNWVPSQATGTLPYATYAANVGSTSFVAAGCPGANGITLPPAGNATTLTSTSSCFESGWTYYEHPSVPGSYLFAINWAPGGSISVANQAALDAADVVIDILSGVGSASDAAGGSFMMGRYWNVINASAFDEPVNIRFYYDPSEETAATTAASDYATNNSLTNNGFMWFKQNGAFNATTDNSTSFQPDVLLTVAGSGTDNGVTYVQFDGLTSFSGGGAAGGAGAALPVELNAFTGRTIDNANKLRWSTASESNFSHFEVQRSNDGYEFLTIAEIQGQENTARETQYSYTDLDFLGTQNYYRLRMVDLDETFEYSKTILLKSSSKGGLSISPNPAKNSIQLQFNSVIEDNTFYTIANVAGQIVMEGQINASKQDLDINALAKGIYVLNVNGNGINETIKLVKE